MQKEKYGFVYIWRDCKHNRYYIGSHWGREDDGYICSSTWMKNAFARRPFDFKRRTIKKIFTNRQDLLAEEQRWINMIPEDQFSVGYYNHNRKILQNVWWLDPERAKTINERISRTLKGRSNPEHAQRMKDMYASGEIVPWNKGKTGTFKHTEDHKKKMSLLMTGRDAHWLKGKPAHNRGSHHTEETKQKLSSMLQGRRRSQSTEFRKGSQPWNKGKRCSEETRRKISETKLSRHENNK